MSEHAGSKAFLYIRSSLKEAFLLEDEKLVNLSERHKMALDLPRSRWRPLSDLAASSRAGKIIELEQGLPNGQQLSLARQALEANERLFFYWPFEQAIECIDRERYGSLRRHLRMLGLVRGWYKCRHQLGSLARKAAGRYRRASGRPLPLASVAQALDPQVVHDEVLGQIDKLLSRAEPISPPSLPGLPSRESPVSGTGVYLRMDFWAPITSGGSYGHTCYVAKNLASSTSGFAAFMANRYSLMDEMGLRQHLLEPFTREGLEINLIRASQYYYEQLYSTLKSMRPSYIYERICLGNFTGARLSQELKIPYFVEYNGSEISMRRSFDGSGYEYEDVYLKAEELAFSQATLISVVSEPIREDLVRRGVDPEKILVNPNGADPDAYAPASEEEKASIRRELGFGPEDCVIGFSGTFGGWHGVDVLAESLPLICGQADNARFLMIGDGNYRHLIDSAIEKHDLEDKVVCAGRVPQQEGARLLRACDLLVSPHNSHMVDSRFFGSPTKIFEYMAMGAGIVASDLEQIGEVLSPGLRASELAESDSPALTAKAETSALRAILCEPGNLEEFVQGVVCLAGDPALASQLGRNARQAILDHYSWEKHVEHLWRRLLVRQEAREAANEDTSEKEAQPFRRLVTGDSYKDEVQNQWDNDACGSHYVKNSQLHTLDWYREVEQYRYEHYAPWMFETMEFGKHAGEKVLEIGAGIGTDLVQFASHGALVTDVDLSSGHLRLAMENFQLRGLEGEFIHHDAETLPFDDGVFDVVYSNGVIHHTPNTANVVYEMLRVLKPGGKAIVMVYAENSLHYWWKLFYDLGVRGNKLVATSMGEIMSETVEISENNARPLVKVYTRERLRKLFGAFEDIEIVQRQLTPGEVPRVLRWVPVEMLGRLVGWNLVIKARKPLPVKAGIGQVENA